MPVHDRSGFWIGRVFFGLWSAVVPVALLLWGWAWYGGLWL